MVGMTHLAIDLDDVVLDFVGGLVKIVNREYDAGLRIEDVTSWDLSALLEPILGEDWWEWWHRRYWLWAKADAVPGAIGALEDLRRRGHYLEIVTAKPRWAEPLTWQWLGKWQPPVHRVTIVDLETPKHAATDAQVLVDDKPANCVAWVNSSLHRRALLFSQPHNRLVNSGAYMVERLSRVDSWKHALEEL